ncbi:MAG: hypothetical protein ACE5EV_06220 [Gaiellales bacterium]
MLPGPPPPLFVQTRAALHRVARYVITPARRAVDDQTWLVQTEGGFGTPELADGTSVRVADTELVVSDATGSRSAPITTLRAAAALAGVEVDASLEKPDIAPVGDVDEPLGVDPAAAAYLAGWYALAWDVLSLVRTDEESADASDVRLWSHHFDPAMELLADGERRRGSYGCSPGDDDVVQPYLYVAPWYRDDAPESPFWNATTFRGAILQLDALLAAGDGVAAAVAFFRAGRDLLAG